MPEKKDKYRVEVYYESVNTEQKTMAMKFVKPNFAGQIVQRADMIIDWVGPVLPSDLQSIAETCIKVLQEQYGVKITAVHDVKIFPHVPDLSKLLIDYKEKGNGHSKAKENNLKEHPEAN